MNTFKHIVMRQIVELESQSQALAFDLQQRMGAFCQNVMPALLDRICTRCDGGDRIFRIDRLEIDLGRVSALHLEEEIGEKTADMLLEALREKVDRLRLEGDWRAAAGQPQPSIRGSPQTAMAVSGDRMLSPADADLEMILYFLDTGSLPWSTVAGAVASLEEKLQKLTESAPDKIDAILQFVAARPLARRRLIFQFDRDVLWPLVRHGSADRGIRLERWFHDFEAAIAAADCDRSVVVELRRSFWDRAFQYLALPAGNRFAAIEFWQQTILDAAGRSRTRAATVAAALIDGARRAAGSAVTLQSNLTAALEQLTERFGPDPGRSRFYSSAAPLSAPQTEEKISSGTWPGEPRSEGTKRPEPGVEQIPADDRPDKKENRPAVSPDDKETVFDAPGATVNPEASLPQKNLETDAGSASDARSKGTAFQRRAELPPGPARVEISRRWTEPADGADPARKARADRIYPKIRFEIKPDLEARAASEAEKHAADPSPAGKKTPPADRRRSSPGPGTSISATPGRTPEEPSKLGRAPDSGPEGRSLTTLDQRRSSAAKIPPDTRGESPDEPAERPQSRSKFPDGIRPRFRYPESTASAGISTADKAASLYLSGTDADTALQEIYVDNAGLVIVWPYLNHFFKALALLEKNDFVDDRSQARAIYLLQYLTTGEEDFPEYVLPLNKLLCGWDIRRPLEREYRLSELEKSEARKLLEAVVNHWSALKQTSVDGLRTSFLQRNAVLVETMRHWLLRVERKPYDMLLERLPWGIAMIRLSWMSKMLTVEW